MDNQHRRIAGYRDLCQEEINLMNQIKAVGVTLGQLCTDLAARLDTDLDIKRNAAAMSKRAPEDEASAESIELRRFLAADPLRWVAIGKTDLQNGLMALVRAVAQPGTF